MFDPVFDNGRRFFIDDGFKQKWGPIEELVPWVKIRLTCKSENCARNSPMVIILAIRGSGIVVKGLADSEAWSDSLFHTIHFLGDGTG